MQYLCKCVFMCCKSFMCAMHVTKMSIFPFSSIRMCKMSVICISGYSTAWEKFRIFYKLMNPENLITASTKKLLNSTTVIELLHQCIIVSWAPNQLCHHRNKLHYLFVIIQYYWFYCFDQINAALVSIRMFLQKNSYQSQMLQTVAWIYYYIDHSLVTRKAL